MPHLSTHLRSVHVFLSSPSDVADERNKVRDLILGLQRGPFLRDRVHIDVVSWDDPHAPAAMDGRYAPQQAVDRGLPTPDQCDLTVVLLWGRMGTPLSEKKPDGSPYLSGTEWEFEHAIGADKPVFVYRRVEKVLLDPDDPAFQEKLEQKRRVDAFFASFKGVDGTLRRSFSTYTKPEELLERLRQDLESFISRVLKEDEVSRPARRPTRQNPPRIDVRCGDVLEQPADVLVLKYAQHLYGVDRKVVSLLSHHAAGFDETRLPPIGETLLVPSDGVVAAKEILFVGVEPLGRFDYHSIRNFSQTALSALAEQRPATTTVITTLHGTGFGLDETEAFLAEVAGLLDAIDVNRVPADLGVVTICERGRDAADRLHKQLTSVRSQGRSHETGLGHGPLDRQSTLATAGRSSQSKPLVFVAMPFASEYDDRFHYGISSAVNAAGFLCERADLASFTGDVTAWVKQRIDSASMVVADLTSANPNVYLEVGYAWGRGVRTVLLAAFGDELKFDVKTQRCLVFRSIRHLEELLTTELKTLNAPPEGASAGRSE